MGRVPTVGHFFWTISQISTSLVGYRRQYLIFQYIFNLEVKFKL